MILPTRPLLPSRFCFCWTIPKKPRHGHEGPPDGEENYSWARVADDLRKLFKATEDSIAAKPVPTEKAPAISAETAQTARQIQPEELEETAEAPERDQPEEPAEIAEATERNRPEEPAAEITEAPQRDRPEEPAEPTEAPEIAGRRSHKKRVKPQSGSGPKSPRKMQRLKTGPA
jgi:hypothetical protein